jgi:hypothetical protein
MLRYWLHVVLATLAVAGLNQMAWGGKGGHMLVRVFLSHPAQIEEVKRLGIELVSEVEGETRIDVLVDQRQLSDLRRRDFSLQILMTAEELMALEVKLDPEFHTYQEMLDELLALQSAHPQIARLESVGVSTQESRIIWAFKISDNVHQEEDEPAVLYNGVHHACEVMGLEICMRLINDLLNDYGSDPQVTWWVDNTEIWFVPIVNPDGHSAVTDSISLYWRKNGRDLNGNGMLYEYDCNNSHTCYTEGVNCNRNYDFNWVYGGSGTAWHYDYRGAFPFSEEENVAMRDLAVQQKFVISISYHSFGEIVYYPWYWDGWHTPDDVTLTDLAQQIASRIARHSGVGTYTYDRNGAKVGMSANWLYGTQGTFDFMIETLESPIFIPPGSQVDSIYRSNKPGALYILDRVHETGITGTISDSLTGLPLEARVKIFELYSASVSPRTSDPVFGRYRWLLTPGTYNLEFSKPGYQSKIFSDVVVESGQPTFLNAELAPYAHQTPVLSPWSLVLLGITVLSSGALILILTRKAPGVWKS